MGRFSRYCFLLLLSGILSGHYVSGQTSYNAWLRGTVGYAINGKFKTDLEFQHRRQSGLDNKMPFEHDLMYSFRNWTHYRPNEQLKFSVSPFAYFQHYRITGKEGNNCLLASDWEIRFSGAVLWRKEIGRGFRLVNRGAAEYREFSSRSGSIIRMRDRLGVYYGFTGDISVMVYDELLVNAAGTAGNRFIDHNRIGAQLDYWVHPRFKLELGYLYVDRLPLSGENWLRENNISLNLLYNLKGWPKK